MADKAPENESDNLPIAAAQVELPVMNMASIQAGSPEYITVDLFNELQLELHQLRAEFARLRNEVEAIRDQADHESP